MIAKARKDFARGEYRWVAQVMKHMVFADPDNKDARELCADAFEQLGYQAESGPWRSVYLQGAFELHNGVPSAGDLEGGLKDVWALRTKGSMHFDARTAYVERRDRPQRDHAYLVEKMPPAPALFHSVVQGALLMSRSINRDLRFLLVAAVWLTAIDTERYSDDYPHYFEAQTKWIAENHKDRNIAYTIHLGDITQHNAAERVLPPWGDPEMADFRRSP